MHHTLQPVLQFELFAWCFAILLYLIPQTIDEFGIIYLFIIAIRLHVIATFQFCFIFSQCLWIGNLFVFQATAMKLNEFERSLILLLHQNSINAKSYITLPIISHSICVVFWFLNCVNICWHRTFLIGLCVCVCLILNWNFQFFFLALVLFFRWLFVFISIVYTYIHI